MKTESPSLAALLEERKNPIVAKWLESILKTYSDSAGGFLFKESDPFRNPVGYTLREGLSVLFDNLLRTADSNCECN